jgi:hypothetical protein
MRASFFLSTLICVTSPIAKNCPIVLSFTVMKNSPHPENQGDTVAKPHNTHPNPIVRMFICSAGITVGG